jgi:hypothetical protein
MTVQAGIEVETDLALLVGEMPAIPCEHSQHQTHRHHGDQPASHYVRGFCICYGWTEAYAACPRFVAWIQSDAPNRCPECRATSTATQMFQVLSPIGSTSK